MIPPWGAPDYKSGASEGGPVTARGSGDSEGGPAAARDHRGREVKRALALVRSSG